MYLDNELYMSNAQALTATAASTDYIDLGQDDTGTGVYGGTDMELLVRVDTELDSAGDSATLTIAIQVDTVTNFASPTTLAQSDAIAEAACTANAELFRVKIPHGTERYLRIYYTVGTEDFTSGNISAILIIGRQTNKQGG